MAKQMVEQSGSLALFPPYWHPSGETNSGLIRVLSLFYLLIKYIFVKSTF